MLTLIAALAVSVHVGDRLADAVQQVGLFGDTPVTNFAIDAPGG